MFAAKFQSYIKMSRKSHVKTRKYFFKNFIVRFFFQSGYCHCIITHSAFEQVQEDSLKLNSSHIAWLF